MSRALIFFCLLATLSVRSQELIRSYVQNSSVRLTAISPDTTDYTDLEPLAHAIGGSRVVMLGEQDHGDAPAFSAKIRIIKFLHEKMSFNVLAFESDFFGLNYSQFGANPDSFFKATIPPIWTYCKTSTPLFGQYLIATRQTPRPLLLSGFDSQIGMRYTIPLLDSVMRQLQLPLTHEPEYSDQRLPLLKKGSMYSNDTLLNRSYLALLDTVKEQLLLKLRADDFWCMITDNLQQLKQEMMTLTPNLSDGFAERMNGRDRQMAANLRWICEKKYPGEKIIVWAHNYHVSKGSGHYKEAFKNSTTSMGTFFTRDSQWMRQTYIIGFSSYEGTAGRLSRQPQVYKLPKPPANSYENWIDKSWDYAFTDFRRFTDDHPDFHTPFSMAGGSNNRPYHRYSEEEWTRIFDGIVFIRKMYSCIGL